MIIPAYNRAEMLRRSLAGAWAQEPAVPDEVIVVDDGSEDDTAGVAAEMGARVIRHRHNRGLAAARNTGLRATSHPWVALLDSDDEWLSHHLAVLWELRGDHVLVASSALAGGTDPSVDQFAGPVERSPVVLRSGDRLIYPANIIPASAAMFRRELALDVGGFSERRGFVAGFDMWLRLLERGTGVCSPRVSVIYHRHPGQMTAHDMPKQQLARAEAAKAHLERVGGPRVSLQRSEGVHAWDSLKHALEVREPLRAARWGAHLIARPQRIVGLLGILLWRHRKRRRSAAMRRAGVGRTPTRDVVGTLDPRPAPQGGAGEMRLTPRGQLVPRQSYASPAGRGVAADQQAARRV